MRLRRIVAPMIVCSAALACGLLPASASAATGPTLVGSVSDPVNLSGATSVAISGNYSYSTAYYAGELTAVDISNPAHPFVAGHSSPNNNVLNAVTVTISGGYAYVVSKNANASHTNGDNGTGNALSIFDIHTNPASPTLVGTVQDGSIAPQTGTLFGAYGVAVQGNFAFVTAQGCLGGSQPCPGTLNGTPGNDFAVINITNPATPALVPTATIANPTSGPFTGALSHADSLTIAGNTAFVTASYSHTLTAINISNPLIPAIVGKLTDSQFLASANDVAVQGNFAYVADETAPAGRFTVVDVTDPAHMRVVGSVTDPALTFAYRVKVSGHEAFVSSSFGNSVTVIDISNPASPTVVGKLVDPAHLSHTTGLDLAVAGRYLVASSPYLSTENQTNYPPYPLQTGGPTATGSISVIDLTGGGTGPVVGVLAPVVSGLHQSARVWREHGPKKARHRPPRGTKFRFNLSKSGSVTLSFVRLSGGRIVNGRCVAQTRKNRHHRACQRSLFAGKLTLNGLSGTNTVTFSGKLGGRFLKPGRYALGVTASASGLTSAKTTITFTIVSS